MNNKPGNQSLKETVGNLKDFFSSTNLVSKPIDFGDVLVYPLAWYGFGFGGGGGGQKDTSGETDAVRESGAGGYGYGAGGAMFPFALVVVHKKVKGPEAIQVVPLESPVGQMISALVESMTPKIADAFKTMVPERAAQQPGAGMNAIQKKVPRKTDAGKATTPKKTASSRKPKRVSSH
jgi:uncharacterized spore protein YtfJ